MTRRAMERMARPTRLSADQRLQPVPWGDMSSLLKDRRILLVEDDMILAMELEDLLLDMGCEVVGPYADLARVMPVVETEHLDGAIMDLNLRGTLSYPAVDRLRARHIPVVVASGYADLPAVRKRLEGVPLLGKPYDLERIRDTIETEFSGRGDTTPAHMNDTMAERG
jgi:DNA-binding NtrC family response regulator